jgi:hypothetical protein
MPPEIAALADRFCRRDCHSNARRWPPYRYVAAMSWFVADHVHGAKRSPDDVKTLCACSDKMRDTLQ